MSSFQRIARVYSTGWPSIAVTRQPRGARHQIDSVSAAFAFRMVRCAAVSILALILATAQTADAKCAGPGVVFAPASGAHVSGVTWVFVPSYHEPTISVESRHGLDVAIDKVSDNDSFRAYRVSVVYSNTDLETVDAPAYTVSVDTGYGRHQRAGYRLFPGSRAAAPSDRVLLENPAYERDAWTCSHTDAVTARPTIDAWAYRIEWARTEASYRAGKREVVVVPRSMGAFWGDPGARAVIELGHLNCFGETVPSEALTHTVYLGVVPLGDWEPGPAPEHPIAVRSGEPPMVEALGEPEVAEIEYRCGLAMPENRETIERHRAKHGLPLALLFAVAGALAGLLLGGRASRSLDRRRAARLDALSLPQLALVAGVIAMAGSAPLAAAGGFVTGLAASIAGAVTALRRG